MIIPSCSIIIAFYERIDFLKLVLASLERQTFTDFEVIIADDGSPANIAEQVDSLQENVSFPLRHIWQENHGFRKNKILNQAILASNSDYLIFIDGDCVLQNHFVEEYMRYRKRQVCLTGRRVNLSPEITKKLTSSEIAKGFIEKSFWRLLFHSLRKHSSYIEKGWYCKNTLMRKIINSKKRGLLGSNFSLYKDDILAINGFDERYQYPSIGEDTDIEYRLKLNGVQIQSLNNIAIQYHLFHPEQPRSKENIELFKQVKKAAFAFTPFGIQKSY